MPDLKIMFRPLRIKFPNAGYHVMNRARLSPEAFPRPPEDE